MTLVSFTYWSQCCGHFWLRVWIGAVEAFDVRSVSVSISLASHGVARRRAGSAGEITCDAIYSPATRELIRCLRLALGADSCAFLTPSNSSWLTSPSSITANSILCLLTVVRKLSSFLEGSIPACLLLHPNDVYLGTESDLIKLTTHHVVHRLDSLLPTSLPSLGVFSKFGRCTTISAAI